MLLHRTASPEQKSHAPLWRYLRIERTNAWINESNFEYLNAWLNERTALNISESLNVCMNDWMQGWVNAWMCVCVRACACVCLFMPICIWISTCMDRKSCLHVYICARVHAHICIYAYICMLVYLCAYITYWHMLHASYTYTSEYLHSFKLPGQRLQSSIQR